VKEVLRIQSELRSKHELQRGPVIHKAALCSVDSFQKENDSINDKIVSLLQDVKA